MNATRRDDSFTILQAAQIPAAVTLIEERDGAIGVFCNRTAKRLGTLVRRVCSTPLAFWSGFFAGFVLVSIVALVTFRFAPIFTH